jgi:hypothetical protein
MPAALKIASLAYFHESGKEDVQSDCPEESSGKDHLQEFSFVNLEFCTLEDLEGDCDENEIDGHA